MMIIIITLNLNNANEIFFINEMHDIQWDRYFTKSSRKLHSTLIVIHLLH